MKKSFFAYITLTLGFFIMDIQNSAGQSIVVSKDGTGNYKTISEAIRAASPHGDDILVMPGEYVELILIEGRKELNIIAQGEVWIKRKASENVLTLTKCYKVNFRGFKLNGTVVFTDCENSTLVGCTVTESKGGVFVSNSAGTEILANTFTRNTSTPIVIEKSQQTRVINNVLHDNTGAEGIRTIKSDISEDVIKNNTIAYNRFLPISIGEGCRAVISNNIVCFNTIPGNDASVGANVEAGNVKARNNNIYGNKNASGESIAYRGIQPEHDLSVDPMFVNGPERNVSLKTTSPCYGAGQDGTTRFGEPIIGINLGADLLAKVSPINYEEQLDEGVAQRKRKNYQTSADILSRLLKTYPGNINAWFALSDTYFSMKKYNDFHAACLQAVKISPDNHIALYNLAVAKLNIGRATEGLPLLDQALRNGADEANILIAQGDCNISLQKFSSGIELYQKALGILYNDDPNAMYKIARAYALQNKAAEGMMWLEKAIKKGADLKTIETDPDIVLLRKTEAYSKLKQEYGF